MEEKNTLLDAAVAILAWEVYNHRETVLDFNQVNRLSRGYFAYSEKGVTYTVGMKALDMFFVIEIEFEPFSATGALFVSGKETNIENTDSRLLLLMCYDAGLIKGWAEQESIEKIILN